MLSWWECDPQVDPSDCRFVPSLNKHHPSSRYSFTPTLIDNFSTLCYVRADLSPLAGSAQPKQSKNGKTYWTIVFSIEIHFGLTEFKARIKWTDSVSPPIISEQGWVLTLFFLLT